jgi:glycosyltransferase involved in cell wall biosynthesis
MTPLRVLHLNSMLKGGGTDDRSVRVAYGLMRLGHTVWMAGPTGRDYSKIVQELGLTLLAMPTGLAKLPMIFKTAGFMRRERVQIIHARHGRDYWPAILAARLSGVRPKVVLSRQLAMSPGSWLSRHFLLSQCDAFLPSSKFVAKVLRDGSYEPESPTPERRSRRPIFGDHSKIHVIYGGIDVRLFQPADATAQRTQWGLKPSDYAFAVVGGYTLPRGKGQREFLEAGTRVKAELPNARFLIIGRGNMKEMLEADIARLGLQGVAWLTPYSHDMPAAMNAIDCLVHPTVGTESWGSVICEAHACGKPVIASNLDGIPEAFAPGGLGVLIKPGSVEDIVKAMLEWGHKAPLDQAGRRVLHERVATQYSLERAAEELAELYRSLLGEEKAQGTR